MAKASMMYSGDYYRHCLSCPVCEFSHAGKRECAEGQWLSGRIVAAMAAGRPSLAWHRSNPRPGAGGSRV